MEPTSKSVAIYQAADGKNPYALWYDNLKDARLQLIVAKRIARLCLGNPGDHKFLKDGICELRIDYGPGIRVYYAQHGTKIILLLGGGDKSTQRQDIQQAKEAYHDFRTRTALGAL